MGIRKTIKNVLYFAVGATATGIEALADAADFLVKKGADVVTRGKEVFTDFCTEHLFPDDEEPSVIIEEDEAPKNETVKDGTAGQTKMA